MDCRRTEAERPDQREGNPSRSANLCRVESMDVRDWRTCIRLSCGLVCWTPFRLARMAIVRDEERKNLLFGLVYRVC